MANIRIANLNKTSFRVVIENLLYEANYYDLFEVELWDATETTFYYTNSWIDSSTVNHYTSIDFSGLAEGTSYVVKAFAKSGGNRNFIERQTVTTLTDTPPGPTRPSNWEWTSLVYSAPMYELYGIKRANLVDASEWNNFCSRISEFRAYKGLSSYTFTPASSGGSFTQLMYDNAVSAITPMASVTQSEGFYTKLIQLKNALNSIS